MSRPIKYRAWADDKMHEVRAISFTETGEVFRFLDSEGVERWPTALLQFTGQQDENGKEIYEGDVVRHGGDKRNVVEWRNTGYWLHEKQTGENYWPNSMEVIGNIYENPELLNAKQ